jgi:hypothetical protein
LKFPPEELEDMMEKKGTQTEGRSGEEQKQEDLPYCTVAADPEHERGYREEEPCDDARAGKIDKD